MKNSPVLLLLFALGLVGIACSPGVAKPTIELLSPAHGAQFREGETIAIRSTGTDSAGDARIELLVDGVVVRTDIAPTAQGRYSVTQEWQAAPGEHVIAVRAVNVAGPTSDIAAVSVSVVRAVGLVVSPTAGASTIATPTLAPTARPVSKPSSVNTPAVVPTRATGLIPNPSFPVPPIEPVPASAADIGGTRYMVYHYPSDSFRFLCAMPCPLEERMIFAGYQGWKAKKEVLVRYIGIDVVSDLAPIDVHLTSDPQCVYENGVVGSFGTTEVNGQRKGRICIWQDREDARNRDLRFPFSPESAVRLGGLGAVLHEYLHGVLTRRFESSHHDYIFPIEYNILGPVSSTENQRDLPSYQDPCSQPTSRFSKLFYTLCQQNHLNYGALAPSLIELDRVYQAGRGERNLGTGLPAISVNQYRAVLNGLLGAETLPAFIEAGVLKSHVGPAPVAPSEGACTNKAALVADVTVPLHTLVDAGKTFTKTWRLKNVGTCAWGSGYQMILSGGEAMSASNTVALPNTAPGATADVSVPLTAPSMPGVHVTQWRLRTPSGTAFGPVVNQDIYVRAGCAVPPNISSFTHHPATISRGTQVTLEWGQVTNVDSLQIDQGVGPVDVSGGSVRVMPAATTTFSLIARCGDNTSTKQVHVPVSAADPNFAVTSVTASSAKPAYTGQCPHLVTFSAVITTNGAGTVGYVWERSDGPTTDTEYVTFAGSGSQTVTRVRGMATSWWERVRIVSPNSMTSNQAAVSITCGQ